MALANGVDLVVELPYIFATQKAETFQMIAISILNALRVSEICFGSEDGQIENFIIPSPYKNEEETFNYLVKQFMDAGNSYAKATSDAFSHLTSEKT